MSYYMGIDIGYSNVKCVDGTEEDDRCSVFPVGSMPSERFKEIFMSVGGDAIKTMEVLVDGAFHSVVFEPGKVPGVSRSVTEKYIDSVQYKSLFYGLFVTSCGFDIIKHLFYWAANQVDHRDEISLVTVATRT